MMNPKPLPQRKSPRLQGYDYAAQGAYFVTICTHERYHLFGAVQNGVMILDAAGEIAAAEWERILAHRPTVIVDAYVVMPNHVHAIIFIMTEPDTSQPDVGTRLCEASLWDASSDTDTNPSNSPSMHPSTQRESISPAQSSSKPVETSDTRTTQASSLRARGAGVGSLGAIVAGYKSGVTRRVREALNDPYRVVWQERYHDHIIRDDPDLNRIREYVVANPARWADDTFYA